MFFHEHTEPCSAPLIEANAKVWSIDQVLICQNEDEKNVGIKRPEEKKREKSKNDPTP